MCSGLTRTISVTKLLIENNSTMDKMKCNSPSRHWALSHAWESCDNIVIPYRPTLYSFTHEFALYFLEHLHAKNMTNQSKMQRSLLDMMQHALLLMAVAHKYMQLKAYNMRRKHRWWVHLNIIQLAICLCMYRMC